PHCNGPSTRPTLSPTSMAADCSKRAYGDRNARSACTSCLPGRFCHLIWKKGHYNLWRRRRKAPSLHAGMMEGQFHIILSEKSSTYQLPAESYVYVINPGLTIFVDRVAQFYSGFTGGLCKVGPVGSVDDASGRIDDHPLSPAIFTGGNSCSDIT